jgi:hypothetical protein
MLIPPHLSLAIKLSGTPVSVMSNTSKRQQQASQFAQVTLASGGVVVCVVINYFSSLVMPGEATIVIVVSKPVDYQLLIGLV